MGSHGRTRLTVVWIIVALALLPIAVIAIAVLSVLWTTSRKAERAERAIRDAGEPLTLEELDAWYSSVPDADNAALVYEQAFRRMVRPRYDQAEHVPLVGYAKLPPPGEPLPKPSGLALVQYVAENSEALELLHKAAQYDSCRFPIDLREGVNVDLSHLKPLREGARLMLLEAIASTEFGDHEGAVRSVTDLLALPRALDQEPVLISALVRAATFGLSVTGCEYFLNRGDLDNESLDALRESFEKYSTDGIFHRALAGERCSMFAVMAMWRVMPGVKALDRTRFLEVMGRYIAASDMPPKEGLATAQDIADEVDGLSPVLYLGTTLFAAGFSRALAVPVEDEALLRCAKAALAIERYRLDHDALPGALNDLVSDYLDAVPEDPFDGAPLRYKLLEPGYVVYSVGRNTVDEGGAWDRKRSDITFTVTR